MKTFNVKKLIPVLIALALLISYVEVMPLLVHATGDNVLVLGNQEITIPAAGNYAYGTTIDGHVTVTDGNADSLPGDGWNWVVSCSGDDGKVTLELKDAVINDYNHVTPKPGYGANSGNIDGYAAIFSYNAMIIKLTGTNIINATGDLSGDYYAIYSGGYINISGTDNGTLTINTDITGTSEVTGINSCDMSIRNSFISINNNSTTMPVYYLECFSVSINNSFLKTSDNSNNSSSEISVISGSDNFMLDYHGKDASTLFSQLGSSYTVTPDTADALHCTVSKGTAPTWPAPVAQPSSSTKDTTPSSSNTEKVVGLIKDTKKGDTVTIYGDSTKPVSKDILKALKETGANLEIKYNGYTWIIDGSSITNTDKDIDLIITKIIGTLPTDISTFEIAYNGDFPFSAKLKVDVAGYIKDGTEVYLYKVVDGKRIYQSSAITKGYSATFQRNSASQYVISLVKPKELSAGECAHESVTLLN